jgi:hypothetical protein
MDELLKNLNGTKIASVVMEIQPFKQRCFSQEKKKKHIVKSVHVTICTY